MSAVDGVKRLTGNGGEWFSIWGQTKGVPAESHARKTLQQEGFKTPRGATPPSRPPSVPRVPADAKVVHSIGGVLRGDSASPSKKGTLVVPSPARTEDDKPSLGGAEDVPASVALDRELFPADLDTHIGDARRNAKSCALVSSTDTQDDSSPKTLKIADAGERNSDDVTPRTAAKPHKNKSCVRVSSPASRDVEQPHGNDLSPNSRKDAKSCLSVSSTSSRDDLSPNSRRGAKSCVSIPSTSSRDDLSPPSRTAAKSCIRVASPDFAVSQDLSSSPRNVTKASVRISSPLPRDVVEEEVEDTSQDSRASEDAANDSLSDGSQDVTDRWVGDGALLGASEHGYGVTPEDDQPKKSIGARSCLSKSSVASRGRCVSWKASDSKKMSAHSSFSFCKTGNVESPRRSLLEISDDDSERGEAEPSHGDSDSVESPRKEEVVQEQPETAFSTGPKKSTVPAQSKQRSGENAFSCDRALSTWSVEDVCAWASSVPCLPEEMASLFGREAVNGLVLGNLTETDLMLLGISKFGWRRQLMLQIQQLQQNERKTQEKDQLPRSPSPWSERRHPQSPRRDPFSVTPR